MAACRSRTSNVAAVLATLAFATICRGPAPAECARILAVQTISGRSHWNFMRAVLRSLTDAGHRVTAFTPFPDGERANYAEVDTSGTAPPLVDLDLTDMAAAYGGPFRAVGPMTGFYRAACDAVHANRRLRSVIDGGGGGSFDAIVAEPTGVDCVSVLARALDAPIVYAIPTPMLTFAERSFTGHVSSPACVPHVFAGHAVPATFAQRLANAALLAYSVWLAAVDGRATKAAAPRPYDSAAAVRPSVIFQNTHYITEAPRPVPANVVDVGGIHLLQPVQNVPKDILDFIEESPQGVIYFSFGSTLKLSSLPKHVETIFKAAIANVTQRVLWKYETEMNDMPKNVMIKKWFPQREILLHPKVKLFISHGGISGVYEAVDAGVPVLGFPLFFDQIRNIEHLVDAGMAISMDLLNMSQDMFLQAILKLINNDKYTINAKVASNRFKDRPMSPAQSVVYWTEYVIRHKGAPHLRSDAFNLTWYQYFLLDVIGAVFIFIFLVLFITYKVIKCIYYYISKRSNKNKLKTQ